MRKASYATSSLAGLPSSESVSEEVIRSMECADGRQRHPHPLEVHGYTSEKLEKAHRRFNSVSKNIDEDISIKLHFYYCDDITTVGQLVDKIQEFEAVHLRNRVRSGLQLPRGRGVTLSLLKLFTKQKSEKADKKIVIGNNKDHLKISDMVAEIKNAYRGAEKDHLKIAYNYFVSYKQNNGEKLNLPYYLPEKAPVDKKIEVVYGTPVWAKEKDADGALAPVLLGEPLPSVQKAETANKVKDDLSV